MNRLLFFLSCLSLLYGQTVAAPDRWENLRHNVEKALAAAISEQTGRQGVSVTVEMKSATADSKTVIDLSLSERDSRETVLSLKLTASTAVYRVQGRVLTDLEKEKITQVILQTLGDKAVVQWQIETITPVGFGVIAIPCADLYVKPQKERGDNLASQLLYGMAVRLLSATPPADFFLVQSVEDGYLGWLAADTVVTLKLDAWQHWVAAPKAYLQVTLDTQPRLYPGTAFALLPGTGLADFAGQKLTLPDGKFLAAGSKVAPQQIIATAMRFLPDQELGPNPYLWGGTCVSALDCSGLVQLVYRMNGILLPRDADQQQQYSRPVTWEQMQPGDLVFFSKKKNHATHVGLCLSGHYIIHSSPAGTTSGVKINDLEGNSEYEKYLKAIFFGAGRVLGK